MATRVEDDSVSFAPLVGHSLGLARFSENTLGRVVLVDTASAIANNLGLDDV